MDPLTQFLSTLLELAATEVAGGLRGLLTPESSIVQKAAIRTGVELKDDYANLEQRLLRWVGDGDLIELMSHARQALDAQLRAEIVASFVDSADFYIEPNDQISSKAAEVLETFFGYVHELLLASQDSSLYQAQLNQSGFVQIGREFKGLKERLLTTERSSLGLSPDIERLLKERKFNSAKEVVQARLQESELTNIERARLLRALGICQVELCELNDALDSLRRSIALNEHPSTQALRALVLLIRDGIDAGVFDLVDELWEAHGNERQVFAAYVRARLVRGESESLKRLAESNGRELTLKQTRFLAQAFLELGELDVAAKLLDKVVAAEPEGVIGRILAASVLVSQLLSVSVEQRRLPWLFDADEQGRLVEAAQEIEKIVEDSAPHEAPGVYEQAVITQAHIAELRQDYDTAISAGEALKRTFPRKAIGWEIHGRVAKAEGAIEEAVMILREGLQREDRLTIRWPLASCLHSLGRLEEAVEVVEPVLDADDSALAGDASDLYLSSLRALKRTEDADKFADRLKERRDEHISFLLAFALDLARRDLLEQAIETLQDAEIVEGALVPAIRLERGRVSFWAEDFEQAVECFTGVVEESSDAHLQWMLAEALYRIGQGPRAARVAGNFLEREVYDRRLAQLKAQVEWDAQDFERALETWRMIDEGEDDWHLSAKLNIIQILNAQGEHAAALDIANRCIPRARGATADEGILLAKMLAYLEHPDAIDVGYEVVRVNQNEPEVLHGFFQICIRISNDEEEIAVIREGVEVLVDGPEGQETFILDRIEHRPRLRDELEPDTPLWDALLGREVGDSFKLGEGEHAPRYTVQEIYPKYVGAFRRAIRALSTRFAHLGLVQAFPAGENEVNIFLQAEERARVSGQILARYASGEWPLCHTAERLGRSLASLWLNLSVDGQRHGVVGSSGTVDEAATELEGVRDATTLILTTTGFLAAEKLRLFNVLDKRFDQVIAPRTILKDLKVAYAENVQHPGTGFFGKVDGEYVLREYPPEFRAYQEDLFDRLSATVRSHVEIKPVWERTELSPAQEEQLSVLDATLGPCTVDGGLLAGAGKLVLDDDMRSRRAISATLGVSVISAQSLLLHLRNAGLLTADDFFERMAALVAAGYQFVRVTPEFVLWLVRQPAKKRENISAALAYLAAPRCTTATAVNVAAEFIKEVWLERLTQARRILVLDETLNQILTHGPSALRAFIEALRREFGDILYLQLNEVLEAISARQYGVRYK